MVPQDSPAPLFEHTRVDAMRALRYAVEALDDERLLDRPTRDRLITTFCAAYQREIDEARKLTLFRRWAS
jgi:hypothetical protein